MSEPSDWPLKDNGFIALRAGAESITRDLLSRDSGSGLYADGEGRRSDRSERRPGVGMEIADVVPLLVDLPRLAPHVVAFVEATFPRCPAPISGSNHIIAVDATAIVHHPDLLKKVLSYRNGNEAHRIFVLDMPSSRPSAEGLLIWDLGSCNAGAMVQNILDDLPLQENLARLIEGNIVSCQQIYPLFARRHGLAFSDLSDCKPASHLQGLRHLSSPIVPIEEPGKANWAVAPPPDRLFELLPRLQKPGMAGRFVLATPIALRHLIRTNHGARILDHAIGILGRRDRDLSAAVRPGKKELCLFWIGLFLLFGLSLIAPAASLLGLAAILSTAFLAFGILRLRAAIHMTMPPRFLPLSDEKLPRYCVMIALKDEAHMVSGLVRALEELDYPPDLLDIKLVLEADDQATRDAVAPYEQRHPFDVVVVPPGEPGTKPRALAYALQFVTSELICIFDAEDRPDPQQLRVAASAFKAPWRGLPIGCVQAALVIDRAETWLQWQFALEYRALFEGLLPYLAARGLPLPLGGTSNHFRAIALRDAGGWDPWNVTEDADLGIRMSRYGWGLQVIASQTFEEAPAHLSVWLRQRVRWIKGWILTWLVHSSAKGMRAEIGLPATLTFHTLLGVAFATALLHPLGFSILVAHFLGILPLDIGHSLLVDCVVGLSLASIAAGYGGSIVLAAVTAGKHVPRRQLVFTLATIPFYWLLISIAALLALVDLGKRPHYWAKTPHVASSKTAMKQD